MIIITKIKKIILLFTIFLNILFFVSPVFAAADCPQGKVVVIGDSLAVGIGGSLASGCPNVSYKETTKVGADTNEIVSQFNSIKKKGYTTLIVMGGYNDAHGTIPVSTTLNNLNSIYSQAKAENMTVVALTVPTLANAHPDKVKDINIGITNSGASVLPAASMWATSGNVHNSNSYSQVANAIKNNNYPPGTGTGQTPTTTTPTTNDVKATCKGTDSLDQSQTKDITFSTTETDQNKIATGATDQCYKECDTEGWTNCTATVSSVTAQAPTQTPVSDSTGTTPGIDTTATAPTYEANPASLISGSTACEIWKNAFNLGISFIGVAALAGIFWGGFGYITSYGNQEKITSAKETIWGSVAGMFIGLFAYVLFSLINPYVLQCKIEAPFKLSVNTSGTTQGTGDGTIPGGNIPGAQVGDLGKCTKNYDPNNSGSHGYGQIIQAASQRFGVDPYYVESTIQHESNFDNAVVSPAGARTMGQFMPNTFAAAAKKWGGEIDSSCFNPINKTTFQSACLQWIAANPKKIPEIVAAEIARIKGAIPSDNYACVAAGYVGGPGEAYNKKTGYYSGGRAYCNGKKVDKGTTDYVNNAAVGYNKSCSRGQ
ncbi:MAG: transglycosylase SLT domain-containing protein [Patescibacteria group bacterium]|nr:transglycosylase SLT domain-containing protein [Patescibacteria group bacterium]